MKILALVLFILMYIVMVARQKYRPHAAMAVAALYLVTGILPLGQVISSINWNVLMMISGTMILVDYFIASGMPLLMADLIMEKSKNVMWIIILMSLFAGLISAFIDNGSPGRDGGLQKAEDQPGSHDLFDRGILESAGGGNSGG